MSSTLTQPVFYTFKGLSQNTTHDPLRMGMISIIYLFGYLLLSFISLLFGTFSSSSFKVVCLIFTALYYSCCYCCVDIIKLLITNEWMLSILWELAVGGEGGKKKVVMWAITVMVNGIICKNNLTTIYLKSSQLKNWNIEVVFVFLPSLAVFVCCD